MRRSDDAAKAQILPGSGYTPGTTLMGRAALGIRKSMEIHDPVMIFVGGGNNGGDGYALACLLADEGIHCSLHVVSDKVTEDGGFYRDLARKLGVLILPFDPDDATLTGKGTIVDCIFGTGFHDTPRGVAAIAIETINSSRAYVVSADINSGMNGDTGRGALAVKSDLTVTIGQFKNGLLLAKKGMIGRLVCADIGIRAIREENELLEPRAFDMLLAYSRPTGLKEFSESELETAMASINGIDDRVDVSNGSDSLSSAELARKASIRMNRPILVHGKSCDFLALPNGRVRFRRPAWVDPKPVRVLD